MYFFYFYPLGLDRRRTRHPVLSYFLMALMVLAFLWIHYWPARWSTSPYDLVYHPANGHPWTAVTAMFLHGGWMHLFGNLLYLHVFGPPLEDRLGHLKFLVVFLLLGVCGNLAHGAVGALDLLGQGVTGVLGASGAIAGMLSYSLVRFYDARVAVAWWILAPLAGQNRAGRTRVPLAVAVGFWLLLQVVQALLASETGANVSFGAHFGGFALGLILALLMGEATAGKTEAVGARAARYFREGQFHAAAGAWTEFLVRDPANLEGQLELARARRLCRQEGESPGGFPRPWKSSTRPAATAPGSGWRPGIWPGWPTTRRCSWTTGAPWKPTGCFSRPTPSIPRVSGPWSGSSSCVTARWPTRSKGGVGWNGRATSCRPAAGASSSNGSSSWKQRPVKPFR